jgi:preprotein translocase subunit SecB
MSDTTISNETQNRDQITRDAGQAQSLPIQVHAQYIRDISFENPKAPDSLRSNRDKPKMDIDIDMNARHLPDDEISALYEVLLKLKVRADRQDYTVFIGEIEYGATVELGDVAEDQRQPLLLIEVPHLIYPFARQILSQIVQQGGFPPLYLAPIDFRALYLQQFGDEAQQYGDSGTG